MKKQIKKTYRVSHTPAQRFWGILAFLGLFTCGIMTGVGLNANQTIKQSESKTEQPISEAPKQTCKIIEESLLIRLPNGDETADYETRIERAKIYANLSERGCPENQQKFYDLAKQELDVARALTDDKFYDESDTIEVVETYKRLNMQAAAQEILETTKKLVNPTIDFILQVEKIINEK